MLAARRLHPPAPSPGSSAEALDLLPPPLAAKTGVELRRRLRAALGRLVGAELAPAAERLRDLTIALYRFQADALDETPLYAVSDGRLTRHERAALAEVGWHYARNGGGTLAAVVFEGLVALDPRDAYAWLALGVLRDRAGEPRVARACFAIASRLDPEDPAPDLATAQAHLLDGDLEAAEGWAEQGRAKATGRGDAEAARRALALIERVRRAAAA